MGRDIAIDGPTSGLRETASWTFARADYKRRATKWRCPTGQYKPASVCVKADRLHH